MVYFISQINSRVVFRSVVSATCPVPVPLVSTNQRSYAPISRQSRGPERRTTRQRIQAIYLLLLSTHDGDIFAGKQKLHADNLSGDFIYRAIRLLRTLTCASVGCKWSFKDGLLDTEGDPRGGQRAPYNATHSP